MLFNPPPPSCEHCGDDPATWTTLEGPDQLVSLGDGRQVTRRGRGHVCARCGHTVPVGCEGIHQGMLELSRG